MALPIKPERRFFVENQWKKLLKNQSVNFLRLMLSWQFVSEKSTPNH